MARTALFHRLGSLFARVRPTTPSADGATRRELLAGLSAALAVPALSSSTGCRGVGEGRIAIIGGGIAGVYAAYRLTEADVAYDLYEASPRLGGRMYTGTDLFTNGHLCELGGELIDTNHATLFDLAEELEIQLDDRQGGAFASLTVDTWWIEGEAIADEVLVDQLGAVLADVQADFDGAETDDDTYTALSDESLADWLDRRVPVGTYPELHKVLDVAYRGEFGLENDQQSALNLIYLLGLDDAAFKIFGESDERYHTHLGNSVFVDTMVPTLPAAALHVEHALTAISGRGPYQLTLSTPEGTIEREVDIVLFALPYSTLRKVDIAELKLSKTKRQIIEELGYGTNAKVMAGFTAPVWRTLYEASGSVTSDLPFQQCWDTSLGQDGPGAILTNFLGGEQGIASAEGTPEAWVSDVLLPGLDEVFPGAALAWTGEAVRMHWPTHPHTLGSYTCYMPGQWEWWSTEGKQERNLHFCGEHTSADFQGWMEGGAESGARVAAEVLEDLKIAYPAGLERQRALARAMPPIPEDRPNAIRVLKQRRLVLRTYAELKGRTGR